MNITLYAALAVLMLVLLGAAVLFYGAWRDADTLGSVRDWGKASVGSMIALAGLELAHTWWLATLAVSALFAALAFLVRGLIRFAQGRVHSLLNALARQLTGLTVLVVLVHLALAASAQHINLPFIFAVGSAYLACALLAGVTAWQQSRESAFLRAPLTVLLVGLTLLTAIHLLSLAADVPANRAEAWLSILLATAGAGAVFGALALTVSRLRRASTASAGATQSDPLTGLQSSAVMAATIRRHCLGPLSKPVVLLTIEVDHFDRLSETIGPEVSQRLVRQVSRAIRMSCRETDTVSRCGSARFVVACIGADQHEGLDVAERIRLRVKRTDIYQAQGQPVTCSVSIGLSMPFGSLAASSHAARQADKALNQAQTLGGNLTISHRPAR